jgi:hypothetical protein
MSMLNSRAKALLRFKIAVFGLSLVFVSTVIAQTPTAAPPAKPSVGQSIGTVIKDAVTTAFPVVSDIIKAIWPGGDTKNKNPQQATDALNKARQTALDKQKQNFADIKAIAAQLATVRLFFSSCVVAERNVTEMRAFLDTKPTLAAKDFDSLGDMWTKANGPLKQLAGNEIQTQIDAIPDDFARTTLQAIRDANLGQLDVVQKQIGRKDADALRKSLNDLEPKLASANALAGELLGSIGVALNNLPDKIGGALGSTKDVAYEADHQAFVGYLKNLYPAIKP